MTKPAEIADLVAATQTTLGGLDILVNNAGIQHVDRIEKFPVEKWDAIIAVNLSASFHTVRAGAAGDEARTAGAASSTSPARTAWSPRPTRAAYVAAKHGLIGLTKVMGIECADTGVTCNAICPGFVSTPLALAQIETKAKADGIGMDEASHLLIGEKQPQVRFTTVEQIAGLALFLASDTASNMQGTALVSDGGWTAQ